MTVQEFKQGEVIFSEGSFGDAMYEIKSGTVGIYVCYGRDGEQKLTELKEGRIFGEMAAVEVYARTATAVACTDVSLEVIPFSELETYLKENPDRIMLIMRSLSRRLRELTEDYKKACETADIMRSAVSQSEEQSEGLIASILRFVSAYRSAQKRSDPNAESLEALRRREKAANSDDFAPERLSEGDILFREGEQGDCMYEVYWGRIGIFVDYGKAGEKKLTELTQDTFFGEMGFIDHVPRSATAVVLEDETMVLTIREKDLGRLIDQNPAKVLMVLCQLTSRLSKLTEDYMGVCRQIAEMDDAQTRRN